MKKRPEENAMRRMKRPDRRRRVRLVRPLRRPRTLSRLLRPPDGGYPGGNTAEGQKRPFEPHELAPTTRPSVCLHSGATPKANFNTGKRAPGRYLANTADENTATGAGALFSNTHRQRITRRQGAFALFSNTDWRPPTPPIWPSARYFSNTTGGSNTATGALALLANTAGESNTATGDNALAGNTTGSLNTANGVAALVGQYHTGSREHRHWR